MLAFLMRNTSVEGIRIGAFLSQVSSDLTDFILLVHPLRRVELPYVEELGDLRDLAQPFLS